MRLDVITDFCRRDSASFQATIAKRMREQLVSPDLGLARRGGVAA
jgi:hypothetical protein